MDFSLPLPCFSHSTGKKSCESDGNSNTRQFLVSVEFGKVFVTSTRAYTSDFPITVKECFIYSTCIVIQTTCDFKINREEIIWYTKGTNTITTSISSFTPVVNVSLSIDNFCKASIFSSVVPSIEIKSMMVSAASCVTPRVIISPITASFPTLSILSMILIISTDSSFKSRESKSPLRIFLLLMQIVKSSNPRS